MFSLNNILVFQSIIKGHLIKNEYFTKLDEYNLPNTIYCFKYDDSKIDKNTKLTGEYLDLLTSDLTFKSAFNEISYYNKTHLIGMIIDRLDYTTKSNFYSNSEISLTHFYYLNLKFFEIILKPFFKEEDFYFSYDKMVLEIFLNHHIKKQHAFVYFLYREKESR